MVMLGIPRFLCAFHTKIAWAKGLKERVPDEAARQRLRQGLEQLMRLNSLPPGPHHPSVIRTAAVGALKDFFEQHSDQPAFMEYFNKEWANKIGRVPKSVLLEGSASTLPDLG